MLARTALMLSALCWARVQCRLYTTVQPDACTYSFTVSSHDVAAICHRQPYVHSKAPPHTTDMDSSTARQVLTMVTKLLGNRNLLDEVYEAKRMVAQLNQSLSAQARQYGQLLDHTTTLQKQLHLLSRSGRVAPPVKKESPPHLVRTANMHPKQTDGDIKTIHNFTGDATPYQGCPDTRPQRIHRFAPIKSMGKETMKILPRSCYEWRTRGYTTRGRYQIDPDGLEGEPPFTVECVMATTPFAVVHHDGENRTRVKGYESEGSYVKQFKYNGLTTAQLAVLTDSSSKCEQYLKWECRGASLSATSWWTSREGRRMQYWAGGIYPGSYCACGIDRSCARGGGDCNCDANIDYMWLEDSGYLIEKEHLPVSELRMGDTGNQGEEGYYTLGPLRCYSQTVSPYQTSTALLPVETHPPFSVYCDLGGWLVIQRNTLRNFNTFYHGWAEYEKGFGDMSGDFWLGLEKLHQITSQPGVYYTLQITLDIGYGSKHHANYNYFKVSDAKDGYRLEIGEYSGTVPDELRGHRGMKFTTRDRDNDAWPGANCASQQGGWWFRNCGQANLNARRELKWGRLSYLRRAEMRIKPFNGP